MRSYALSALSLVMLAASTTAANQHIRRQAACLSDILSLVEATPTTPPALIGADDCVPATLSAAATSFISEAGAWYTSLVSAISDCPAFPAASASSMTPLPTEFAVCTGEQASRGGATATLSSTSSNAVATSTNPTRSGTISQSKATSSASHSSAASGSATRAATASSSQSANAAARETGVIFAAVAVAALGAAAL